MKTSINAKELNEKIVKYMKNNGIFNKLHSNFLYHITLELLKDPKYYPIKKLKKEKPYIIAAALVIHYLVAFKFENTLNTIFNESREDEIFLNDDYQTFFDLLHIPESIEPIQLIQKSVNDSERRLLPEARKRNREVLKKALKRRLNNIINPDLESSTYYSPPPKKVKRKKVRKNRVEGQSQNQSPPIPQKKSITFKDNPLAGSRSSGSGLNMDSYSESRNRRTGSGGSNDYTDPLDLLNIQSSN